jgi:G:T/U-mismatch repair DNA glycosylase
MKIHPFKPLISKNTKKILVGTLPPENVSFYFSNSSNTRLWDILIAVKNNVDQITSGGNALDNFSKITILESLGLGISDIIYRYERDDYGSTKDLHIDPKEYSGLLQLAADNNISELLFVYQSALKWFFHSLGNVEPVRLKKLNTRFLVGPQQEVKFQNKIIKCTLLPAPLNRGVKGQTLKQKLGYYKKYILG